MFDFQSFTSYSGFRGGDLCSADRSELLCSLSQTLRLGCIVISICSYCQLGVWLAVERCLQGIGLRVQSASIMPEDPNSAYLAT
jgi:hypothetical protein